MARIRKEAFRVNKSKAQSKAERKRKLQNRKRRIEYRLRDINWTIQDRPMFTASNIHYELVDRVRGLGPGGIGAMHLVAVRTGLADAIDRRLHLLKVHLPYHESDHVLNIAYNLLAGGTCLEDLELWRNDEVYLDALGAQRIPDPTTAGDFCRRFDETDVEILMNTINDVRVKVWQQQAASFLEEAIIEGDGTMAETTGECKQGMDINHKGQWGYHPLLISLANTAEPLYLVNRRGNRPSHEGAAVRFDQGIALCKRAGFKRVLLRGDTDFTQARHLDGWHGAGVRFIFGIDAMPNLVDIAESLGNKAWKPLRRDAKYTVKTVPRQRPVNVKEGIVRRREFENIRLQSEEVAEFDYAPGACRRSYRIVVVRKNLSIERGELALFDDVRYFFYVTNIRTRTASSIVRSANDRCNQENLIKQLKRGARALQTPVDNLVSNWAYMAMASLAWTLKAWFALLLPERGRWKAKHRREKTAVLLMGFKRFVNAFMRVPCQVVRTSGRLVYRLLAWNPWQAVFLRGVDALCTMQTQRHPLRC
jgi:hypothetical protein